MTHLGAPDRTLCGLTPEDVETLRLPPIRISKAPSCVYCRAESVRRDAIATLRAATAASGAWFLVPRALRHAWQIRE